MPRTSVQLAASARALSRPGGLAASLSGDAGKGGSVVGSVTSQSFCWGTPLSCQRASTLPPEAFQRNGARAAVLKERQRLQQSEGCRHESTGWYSADTSAWSRRTRSSSLNPTVKGDICHDDGVALPTPERNARFPKGVSSCCSCTTTSSTVTGPPGVCSRWLSWAPVGQPAPS